MGQNYRGPYRLLTNDHLDQLVPGKSASNSIGFEIIKQPHTQQMSGTPTHGQPSPHALNPIEEQENGGVAINVNVPPSPHHRHHVHSPAPANPQFVMPMIQSVTDSNTTCTETATPVISSSQSKDTSPPTPYNQGAPFGFSAIQSSGFRGGFGVSSSSSSRHPLAPYPVHTSPRHLYNSQHQHPHHRHGTEIQIKRDPNQIQLGNCKDRGTLGMAGMSESPPKSISAEFSGKRRLDEMMMDDIDVNLVPDFDVGGDFFDDDEQRDLAGNMDSAFLA